MNAPARAYDVLILGAGYAGLMAAFRLAGRRGAGTVALVNESGSFVERVRLQEALTAPVRPRLPPLSACLDGIGVEFICATVVRLDPQLGIAELDSGAGVMSVRFRRCIYALGSRTDVEMQGAERHAFRLDPGDGPRSASALRHRLIDLAADGGKVVVVGGGNTAVEAAAEIMTQYPSLDVTIVSGGRVGDFGKGGKIERSTREQLAATGVRILDRRQVAEVRHRGVVTHEGVIAADVCVWAAGMRCGTIARDAGLAVDESNRVLVGPSLRSITNPRIIAVGDAARPLAPTGAAYRASAFAALTSAAYASDSLLKEYRRVTARPFSFSAYGQGVAIGRSGVGFITYPDDGRGYFVFSGTPALRIRNLFVRLLVWLLRLERLRIGGARFWIGRDRVSSDQLSRTVELR
jgi:NADH:ubiquinone reductase (H+-translocating)